MRKILLLGLCMVLLISSVNATWEIIDNSTFDSGSNDGWTQYEGQTPSYSGDKFTSSGGDRSSIYKALNFNGSIVNISFQYNTGLQYSRVGITDTTTAGAYELKDYYVEIYEQSNSLVFKVNDTAIKTTTHSDPSLPYDASVLFYSNGTVAYYNVDGFQDSYDYASIDIENLPNAVIWARGNGDSFDNIIVSDFVVSGGGSPTLTLTSDLVDNGNYTNDPLLFNYTGTCTNCAVGQYDCSLYIDNVANETQFNLDFNTTSTYNFTIESKGWERLVQLNITCTESGPNGDPDADLSRSVFIDTIQPDITQGDIANNTVLYHNINNINVSVTFSDTNLFYANISIQKLNSDLSWNQTINYTEANNINTTSYTLNITNNINTLAPGQYKLNAFAADSHTAVDVRTIDWYWLDGKLYAGGLIFEGNMKDVNKNGDLVTYFYEDFDRYKMKVTFDDQALSHQITLTAPDWQYVGDRYGYKGHFISMKEMRWLDFMGQNVKDVTITPLGNDRYMIVVEHYYATDEIEFESIGDLNTIEQDYYFNVSAGFTFYAKDIFTNISLTNFTISLINGSDVLQQRNTTSGLITFNVTSGNYSTNITSPTHASNNTGLIEFSEGGNFTYYLFATNSLYLFVYDEQTNTLITDVNATIKVTNYNVSSNEYVTSEGSKFVSGFSPGTYELRYTADGYNIRSYYATIVGSDTQSIDLYLLNSSHATYTSFVNQDETGNKYEGAYVKSLRHFTECNCFKTVEMDLTNFNGIATHSLEHYVGKYRFIVEYQNATVYTSTAPEGYVLTDSAYTLVWTLLGDTTESFFGTAGLYDNLTWDNTTKSFYYTVNDPSSLIDQFCLYVDEMDVSTTTGYTRRCNNCLTAASGTVTCNMTEYYSNGKELVARPWYHTNTEYSEYWGNPMSVITDFGAVSSLGMLGVFLGFIFIIAGFFSGLVVAGMPGAIIFFDIAFIGVSALKLIVVSLPVIMGLVAISIIVLILVGDR